MSIVVDGDGNAPPISYPEHAFSKSFSVIMHGAKISRRGNAVGDNNAPPVTQDGVLTSGLATCSGKDAKPQ